VAQITECSGRIRRIKCDEDKPSCGQCVRGRRICDGYVNPSPSRHDVKLLSTSLIYPGVCTLIGTDQERHYFDYFRHRTAPQLSGSFDSSFWNRLLLQTTHHQPAVWHAVVALGSLHQNFEDRCPDATGDAAFALQQYVKAIGFVLVPIRERGKQAADVALITCVLFTCFEVVLLQHISRRCLILSTDSPRLP
jgi:hypothetical protein